MKMIRMAQVSPEEITIWQMPEIVHEMYWLYTIHCLALLGPRGSKSMRSFEQFLEILPDQLKEHVTEVSRRPNEPKKFKGDAVTFIVDEVLA